MKGSAPWQALLLAVLCSACSASTPPAETATDVPTEAPTPKPPTPEPPTPAPTPAGASTVQTTPATVAPAPVPMPAPVQKSGSAVVNRKPQAKPPATSSAPSRDSAAVYATVTTLSRGKGVPAETRAALQRIRELLKAGQAAAAVTDLQTQRIGLEGESRLCIEFRSATDAGPLMSEMHRIAAGIDLLDVTETPCPYRKDKTP